jgi:LacI family transcriptional regulator
MPIVFFDRIVNEVNTHKVIVDNYQGAYRATSHLVENGYRKIAAVANNELLSITKERIAGHRAALADHGQPENDLYVRYCAHGGLILSEVEEAVSGLLGLDPRPDAIVSLSDKLTTGSLRILNAKKLNVPGDVALIGFSNSDLTELIAPPLSIVKQPAFEMGEVATDLLIQLIESKRPVTEFETRTLAPQLIIRQSSQSNNRNKVKIGQ